jgi:hypothetical protein
LAVSLDIVNAINSLLWRKVKPIDLLLIEVRARLHRKKSGHDETSSEREIIKEAIEKWQELVNWPRRRAGRPLNTSTASRKGWRITG